VCENWLSVIITAESVQVVDLIFLTIIVPTFFVPSVVMTTLFGYIIKKKKQLHLV